MTELWKDVPGYVGVYQVSNCGRVRSLDRIVNHVNDVNTVNRSRRFKGVMLTLSKAEKSDHLIVRLSSPVKGSKTRFVHRLVLESFGPPRPGDNYECLHINGIASDNRIENLRWGTRSENIQDAVRMGTHNMTRKTHCNKGHEYNESNTLRYKSDPLKRRCRTCERDRSRRRTSKTA